MSRLVQLRSPARAGQSTATNDDALELSPDAPRVYLETFGCQMNEADSALMAGQLRRAGYARTTTPDDADVILVNTCAVREKAEDRVYGRTSSLSRLRANKPDLVIGITGCMAEHLRDKLEHTAPHVNLVAGPDSYRNIAKLVAQARSGQRAVDVHLDKTEIYEGLDGETKDDGISAFVTIQRGCDKFCTFCVVPFTRGRERGVPPREALRQAQRLADAGYKEISLLGQTVNSYRYEDVEFADLLKAVCRIDGIERVRFTSPYPVDFSDRLIDTMGSESKLCPYVHLPVQSGSDRMLSTMKRGYTRDEFMTLVHKLRQIPDIAISTDIMVGFCGETLEDHEQTLSLMQEAAFESAFMFQYSDRGITYAAKRMQDDVPPEEKARRLREVIDQQEARTRQDHADRVGKIEEVLVGGLAKRKNYLIGRNLRFQNVLLPLDCATPGEILRCKVDSTSGHTLFATPL